MATTIVYEKPNEKLNIINSLIEVIETNSLLKELDMKNIKSELKALKDQLGTEKQTFRTWDENDDDDKELLNTKIRLIKTKILEDSIRYRKNAKKNNWPTQLLKEIQDDINKLKKTLNNLDVGSGITKKRKTKNKKKRKTIKKKQKSNKKKRKTNKKKRKSNKKKRKPNKKRNKTKKSKK